MPVQELTAEEDTARLVLAALMRYRGLSGAEVARRVGQTRATVHDKLTGKSRLGLADLGRLSDVLNVRPEVFFLSPDDALRWVLDHAPTSVTVTQDAKVSAMRPSACVTEGENGHDGLRHRVTAVCQRPRPYLPGFCAQHAHPKVVGFQRVTRW